MQTQSSTFHANAIDGETEQDFILLSNDATLPVYFSANDGDFTSDGVTIDQEYCDTEDITFGHAPADKIDFTLINRNGSLLDFPWGEMSAFVAVQIEDDAYHGNTGKIPKGANCAVVFGEYNGVVYKFYGMSDGIYRLAYDTSTHQTTTSRAYQTSVGIVSMVLNRFGTSTIMALGDGVCVTFRVNNNGTPSQFTEITPPRHMAQKLIQGKSVGFARYEDQYGTTHRAMTVYTNKGEFPYKMYELCNVGVFNINQPDALQNETVQFNDAMSVITNFDVDATAFLQTVTYPILFTAFAEQVCYYCGMNWENKKYGSLVDNEYINQDPFGDSNFSMRQILAYTAEMFGSDAFVYRDDEINRNVVKFIGQDEGVWTYHEDRIEQGSLSYSDYESEYIGTLRLKKNDGTTLDIDAWNYYDYPGIYQVNNNPIANVSQLVDEGESPMGGRIWSGGLRELLSSAMNIWPVTPFSCRIICADPSMEIGDMATIYTREPESVPKYDIYGREIVGEYEDEHYFDSPIMKKSLMWRGFCFTQITATGNQVRELDASSPVYSNSFSVQYTNNVIRAGNYGSFNLIQVTGASNEVTLTSGTITQIPLSDTGSIRVPSEDNLNFAVDQDGGVFVAEAGVYKVCGSVYHNISASSGITRVGAYILAGTDFATATEVSSSYITRASGVNGSGGYGITPRLVYLDAQDKVYLAGRVGGDSGSVAANNIATWLLIEKL